MRAPEIAESTEEERREYVTAEIIQVLGKNEVSIFGFDSDEEFMEELVNA